MDVTLTKLRLFFHNVCQSCEPLCQSVGTLNVHCVSACYLRKDVGVHPSGGCKSRSWGGGDKLGLYAVWRMRTRFIFLFGCMLQICFFFNFFNFCTYHSELTGALLFKNPINKNPSLSQKMLAMTLPTEVCTLNLFSHIVPIVPVYHPQLPSFWPEGCAARMALYG
jgi:hypothetical protein